MTLAHRLPRTHCPPGVAPPAVVRIEESTDPKRRARVLAESRLGWVQQLQADLFKIAWRRLRAGPGGEHPADSDPPAVPPPSRPPSAARWRRWPDDRADDRPQRTAVPARVGAGGARRAYSWDRGQRRRRPLHFGDRPGRGTDPGPWHCWSPPAGGVSCAHDRSPDVGPRPGEAPSAMPPIPPRPPPRRPPVPALPPRAHRRVVPGRPEAARERRLAEVLGQVMDYVVGSAERCPTCAAGRAA